MGKLCSEFTLPLAIGYEALRDIGWYFCSYINGCAISIVGKFYKSLGKCANIGRYAGLN